MRRSASGTDIVNGFSTTTGGGRSAYYVYMGYMRRTVFPSFQSPLCELSMRVMVCADTNEVDLLVSEELVGRAVVLGLRIVHSAMFAGFNTRRIAWSFCSLQECVDIKVRIGEDKWKVEALGGEAVAHQTYIEWRHDSIRYSNGEIVNILRSLWKSLLASHVGTHADCGAPDTAMVLLPAIQAKVHSRTYLYTYLQNTQAHL